VTGTNANWSEATWPAPRNVRAVTTFRTGGVSVAPYDSFNLAVHVGDEAEHVHANRKRLQQILPLPEAPRWLTQIHGTNVVDAATITAACEADGSYTKQPGVVCAVLTADCLPVFLCDRDGRRVAVLHAGWRGLVAGVIEAGLEAMATDPATLIACLGPAISAQAYEVGDEVRNSFVQQRAEAAEAFHANGPGKWRADMVLLARQRLAAAGVDAVYGEGDCTFRDAARFYSYRRDGRCGRMASLIWIEPRS